MAASLVWVGALCNKQTRSCTSFCATLCTNLVRVTHYCVSAQNEHVAPGAQAKYTSSTNQLQLQRQNGRRTQAHRSPLRGVCALLHSLKHGIWHSCILVFCFLNSFLAIYLLWGHMIYIYSPFHHPPSPYMQKAGDCGDISPQFFLDFPQNFRLRTRNQYCTQAIAWGSTI